MRVRRWYGTVAGALAVLLATAACTAPASGTGAPVDEPSASGGGVLGEGVTRPLVDRMVQRPVAAAPRMRLAGGLVPPTNRWFSGFAFGDRPQRIFPYPLSFEQSAGGFTAGLPVAQAAGTTVAGVVQGPLAVGLGADRAVVSGYDQVAVDIRFSRGSTAVGTVTLAEGSPLVTYRPARRGTVRLAAPARSIGAGRGLVETGGRRWAVVVTRGAIAGTAITLRTGGTLVLLPVPDGLAGTALTRVLDAAAPLRGVTTTSAARGTSQRTELRYRAADGRRTLVVPLPHQGRGGAACTGATYRTVYGDVPLCIADRLTFDTPTVPVVSALDLGRLTAAERAELRTQLDRDVAASPAFADDTYFGGKTLYRAAMLLRIADQLGDRPARATLLRRLTGALDRWTQPRGCAARDTQCFVYDPKLRTVIGLKSSFGSEQANDHHFHYGYFLYAAGVVARYAPDRARRWAPVLDLLAADLAARPAGPAATFPAARVFDPYFSHSWASGFAPFADGNNQESSSEAITAWTGLSLWATARGDAALGRQASWLLSAETASALAYWVNPDRSSPALAGYRHPMVSINWSGKRDFATWFSAEPSAIVGIQLIPMSPGSTYLRSAAAGGPRQIGWLVSVAAAKGYEKPLGDYVLMYGALAGPQQAAAALRLARKLPESAVDNGNSRTYLLAYLMSARTASR